MTIMRRLAFVLLLSLLPLAMMAQLEQGIEEESRGNYEKALLWYQHCSDPEAKYRMGRLYENGWGVPKNTGTARYYYNQAAKAGHAKAQQIMNANNPATQSSRSQSQSTTSTRQSQKMSALGKRALSSQSTTYTRQSQSSAYTRSSQSVSPQPVRQSQSYAASSKLEGVKGIEDVFKGAHDDGHYIYFNTGGKPSYAKKVAVNAYHFESVSGAKFYDGMLVNEENQRVGFVDEKGNLVPGGFKWDYGFNRFPRFGGGAALVSTHTGQTSYERIDTYYILKKDGSTTKVALDGQINKAGNFNADGIACIILEKTNAKGRRTFTKMYINTQGQGVFRNLWTGTDAWADSNSQIFDLGVFKDGLARFYQNGKYGYINRAGTIVVPAKYYDAENFSEGLAAVQTEINGARKWVYIDTNGSHAIQIAFTNKPGNFMKGYAPVKKANGTYNYINKSGEQMLSSDVYGATEFYPNGCALIQVDGIHTAVITTSFKTHVKFKHNLMEYDRENAPIYWNGLAIVADGVYSAPSEFLDFNTGIIYLPNIKNWHIASDNLILGEIEESAFSSKKAFANINGCRWAFYIDKDEF